MLYPVKSAKRVVPDYGQMDIELRRKGMTKLLSLGGISTK